MVHTWLLRCYGVVVVAEKSHKVAENGKANKRGSLVDAGLPQQWVAALSNRWRLLARIQAMICE